jgi:selenocysteine lyase/cysteine desulfurase
MRQKKIFFNYATVGPLNKKAFKAVKKFLDEFVKIGPPQILEKYDQYFYLLTREASRLLHCNPEEIVFTKNTTEGIIIASETLPLSADDEILLVENEYPANLLPWLKKKKDGVIVKVVRGSDNQEAFKNLLKSITPKTRAVSVSWGQYYDGFMPDMELLSETCRKNNTFLVVDAVHRVGARQIDLSKIHIDFLACGGQKHIGALPGTGFLYVNNKTLNKLKNFKVGIRSVRHFDSNGYTLKGSAERFLDGTQNLAGLVSLVYAIKDINEQGISKIEKKNLSLLKSFKKILCENNLPFVDYMDQANILSLKVQNSEALDKYLRSKNIYIKAVKGVARISFSHTSSIKNFKTLIQSIKKSPN